MLISGLSIGEVYPKLLEVLLGSPESSPRAQRTREQLGLQLYVSDLAQNILVHPVRDLNYRFMVAEWLWIMAGRDDVETLARYNPEMRKFSDDGIRLSGAYGARLRQPGRSSISNSSDFSLNAKETTTCWTDQLTWCVQKLREDPDSRQAVAQIWTPCPGPSKDIPCTLSLQFLCRQDKLHCVVTMRSSDAWLGLPYDFFAFSMITNCLAGELGVKPGSLTMQLGSSHLYEQHWEKATELVARWQDSKTVTSRLMGRLPPCSNFNEILTTSSYLSPYGRVLQSKTKAEALEVLINATKP